MHGHACKVMSMTNAANLISQAYGDRNGQWVKVSEIAAATGLSRTEISTGVLHLMDTDESFRAEPAAVAGQITSADREVAPVIGGEARHMIRWG